MFGAERMDFRVVFASDRSSPQAIDVLNQILTNDPKLRPSAAKLLAHPFFQDVHIGEAPVVVPAPPANDESIVKEELGEQFSVQQLKEKLWTLIQKFKFSAERFAVF